MMACDNCTEATTPAEIPPFRCPHCRTVQPEIRFYEMVCSSQDYSTEAEEWTDDYSNGDADGSSLTGAYCRACERELTDAILQYDRRYPANAIPNSFVHEILIVRKLPLKRTLSPRRNPILALSDQQLQGMIAEGARALGEFLDEREARAAVKAKQINEGEGR
jgi:hypothetical protein